MSVPSVDVAEATFGASASGPAEPADPIERDRWGRPLLPTPAGKVVGHTRASSAGKPLEDTTKLTEWKERQVTVGTLQALLADTRARLAELRSCPDDDPADIELGDEKRREREVAIGMYAAMAQGIMLRLDEIGPQPDKDLVEESRAWRDAVNAIVEQAHAAAGSHDRADLGTYLHAVLDARFHRVEVPPIPERFAARYTSAQRDRDVAAHDAAAAGMITLCRERFVVCDDWTIAGTLDAVALVPIELMVERAATLRAKTETSRMGAKNKARIRAWCDRRLDAYAGWKAAGVLWVMIISDDKTGASMDFGGLAYTAQVAAYATAVFMDPETKERAPLISALPADVDPATVRIDTETSLIVHTPVGTGVCRIYDVPLDEGRAVLAMASDVRAMRNDSRNWLQLVHEVCQPRDAEHIEPIPAPSGRVDRIDSLIRGCESIEELLALRRREMIPVETQVYGRAEMVAPWTAEHEEIAGAYAALLKARLVGPDAKGEATEGAAEAPAPAADPVLAEIERMDSIPQLRGVFAVWKHEWTPERDAAAADRARRINEAKAQDVA